MNDNATQNDRSQGNVGRTCLAKYDADSTAYTCTLDRWHDGDHEALDGASDAIRVVRPDWMTDDQWADLQVKATGKIDELVANARPRTAPVPCTERAWCVMTDPVEHADYHASDPVALRHYDAGADQGWSAHLYEDRGLPAKLVLEGHFRNESPLHAEVDFMAVDVMMLMWAVSTPEATSVLTELLGLMAETGNRS